MVKYSTSFYSDMWLRKCLSKGFNFPTRYCNRHKIRMAEDDGITARGGASRKLYPSLSFLEISVYTATWICGVVYALYNLYMSSIREVRRGNIKYAVEMVRPWWRFWRKDKIFRDHADHEWDTWKLTALQGTSSSSLISCLWYYIVLVGVYIIIYPVLSWICKKFFKQYSLLFSVSLVQLVWTILEYLQCYRQYIQLWWQECCWEHGLFYTYLF